jgi:tetratricopeptide (TPR) repeat protein
LATTLFYQEKWKPTLEAALEGLAHDAENEGCNHLRTMALTKLGRQQEAVASVDAVLQRAPDDAMAHTNKGWALLNQSKPREALEHFREALRIDPTFSYAQAGIVEALKARNPLYRLMLAYFLWMARLSPRARWGVIVGGFFGYQFLFSVKDQHPQLGPWIAPFLFLYVVFALLTWYAVPLFNMLLRFNKFGWYALSPDKRTASNWFAGCLILFIGGLVAYFVFGYDLGIVVALVMIGVALPLVTRFNCDIGWPRQAMTWYAAAMVLVGAVVIALAAMNHHATTQVAQLFIIGFIATPWLANYLMTVTPKR